MLVRIHTLLHSERVYHAKTYVYRVWSYVKCARSTTAIRVNTRTFYFFFILHRSRRRNSRLALCILRTHTHFSRIAFDHFIIFFFFFYAKIIEYEPPMWYRYCRSNCVRSPAIGLLSNRFVLRRRKNGEIVRSGPATVNFSHTSSLTRPRPLKDILHAFPARRSIIIFMLSILHKIFFFSTNVIYSSLLLFLRLHSGTDYFILYRSTNLRQFVLLLSTNNFLLICSS